MGQMLKSLMGVTANDLEFEVTQYMPGTGLAWATLFPLKYTRTFDLKGFAGNEGIPVSADRVSFNVKAPKKQRKTIGSWSGELAKISVSREKNEVEINEYLDAEIVSAAKPEDKAAAQELLDYVYDDVKFCDNAVNYRAEIEALTVASNGKRVFSTKIDGNMAQQEELNFNIPTANFGGVTTKWDDPEADGLADIATAQKKIAKQGLPKPQFAFMSQVAFDRLVVQKTTIQKVASAIMQITGLASTDDVTIDSVNAYQRRHGYPQIVVIDSYVTIEHADGKTETIQPWNEVSVVLSPSAQLGWTYYKNVPTVQNTEAAQTYGSFYKMTRYSEINPMLEVTMAEAYLQPALINRASLCYINTMNTSGWNNGAA